jgi:hypothetical protein
MSKRPFVRRLDHGHPHGQILLGRALFCVGCEIIFTGSPRCPGCASGETVWPLSEWFPSVRTSTVTQPAATTPGAVTVSTRQRHKRPAA